MNPAVGTRVRSRRRFVDVPAGTEGVVVEDYGTGFTVAWSLPDKPLPDVSPEEIGQMMAVDPRCPLRDGFDKLTEIPMLDYLIDNEWVEGPECAP